MPGLCGTAVIYYDCRIHFNILRYFLASKNITKCIVGHYLPIVAPLTYFMRCDIIFFLYLGYPGKGGSYEKKGIYHSQRYFAFGFRILLPVVPCDA